VKFCTELGHENSYKLYIGHVLITNSCTESLRLYLANLMYLEYVLVEIMDKNGGGTA
jgi:hypothetical protein